MPDSIRQTIQSPVRLTIAGSRVEVRQLSLEVLPEFLQVGTPVIRQLMTGDHLAAIAQNLRACHRVAALLCVRDVNGVQQPVDTAWIAGLPLRDQLNLFATAMEANSDFFGAEVVPALIATMGRMTSWLAGVTSSMTLSVPDTTGGIS
jgi:hypothetical protein